MHISQGCPVHVDRSNSFANHLLGQSHRCSSSSFSFSRVGVSPVNNMTTPFSSAVQQLGGEQQLFRHPQASQFFHGVFQLVNALTQLIGANQANGIGHQAPSAFSTTFGHDPFDNHAQAAFDLPQLRMTACPAASFENPFSNPSFGCGGNTTSNAYFQLLGEQVRGIR